MPGKRATALISVVVAVALVGTWRLGSDSETVAADAAQNSLDSPGEDLQDSIETSPSNRGRDGGQKSPKATTTATSQSSETAAPPTSSTTIPTTAAPPTTTTTSTAAVGANHTGCPSNLKAMTVIGGAQFEAYRTTGFPDQTLFDAATASWAGRDGTGAPIHWAVTIRSPTNSPRQGRGSCWNGGDIRGPWEDTASDVSWEDPYHHAGGLTVDVPDLTAINVRITNQGDGVRTEDRGLNLALHRAYLQDIHDDCVENDYLHNLTVINSRFDGCYVAFSARPHSGNESVGDRTANLWTIRNSLVRLEPQPTVYRGPAPGHGGFFKWDERAPRVALHNTVFRVDQHPNHGTIGIPSELQFESCSNNTMVWLGEGPFPESLPDCFTITSDRSVWDAAVARWNSG